MNEQMTFEAILKRMLAKVPGTVDKREGAIIYDALAPAALALTNMYIELDGLYQEAFADTASRDYLILRAAERGIIMQDATCAIMRGEFNQEIPLGSRFTIDKMIYAAIEQIASGIYKMQCEMAGEEGNACLGDLIPINYIPGLTQARLTEIMIPGEDPEDTEALRKRYFNSLDSQAFGGNVTDYTEKVQAINGVGGVKVYPVWAGGGTVKLVIQDSSYQKPGVALIDTIQTAIDPTGHSGQGYGIAPIGHKITVRAVSETPITIAGSFTLQNGYLWVDVLPHIQEAIESYLQELRKTWAESTQLVVRTAYIDTKILAVIGVLDIENTTINGQAQNLALDADSIPILHEVNQV